MTIYLPSSGATAWKALLAEPDKHWQAGYSAMALAQSWESADGLPPEISLLLSGIGDKPKLLLALPEHKVPLPGSSLGASQNDIFALIRAGDTTLATAIEGKVDESFDRMLGDWLVDASAGKRERLAYLSRTLGLTEPLPVDVHYQLLHRTASALIEAERFKTDAAAMIVHSFSPTGKWFDAFARFAQLYEGVDRVEIGQLIRIDLKPRPLYLGWAKGDPKFLDDLSKGGASV